jgi:uncharacterized membrane protein YgcG
MNKPEISDQELARLIVASLKEIPERNSAAAATGRKNFIAQSREIKMRRPLASAQASARLAISVPFWQRLKGWEQNLFQTKTERRKTIMINALIALVVSAALLFGSAGAAVFAAQDSLPDELLYGVKTAGEDLRMQLSTRAQARLSLALEFAGGRVEEMASEEELQAGVQQPTASRYTNQIRTAFDLAAGMNNADAVQAMRQIQEALQNQAQQMSRLQDRYPDDPLLAWTRLQTRQQLRLLDECQDDPQQLRQRLKDQQGDQDRQKQLDQNQVQPQTGLSTETNGSGAPGGIAPTKQAEPAQTGAGPQQPGATPQGGFGPGPQYPDSTPQPTARYGPGPDNPAVTPAGSNGPLQNGSGEPPENRGGNQNSGGGGNQNQGGGEGPHSSGETSKSGGNAGSSGGSGSSQGPSSQQPGGGS